MKIQNDRTNEEKQSFEDHEDGKEETNIEQDKDRRDNNKFTVHANLQNVFASPTAEVLHFIIYKRKLDVFMTAHCSANYRGCKAMWHEGQSG